MATALAEINEDQASCDHLGIRWPGAMACRGPGTHRCAAAEFRGRELATINKSNDTLTGHVRFYSKRLLYFLCQLREFLHHYGGNNMYMIAISEEFYTFCL